MLGGFSFLSTVTLLSSYSRDESVDEFPKNEETG